MKSHWFQKQGHKQLLIFCNGWGMDENPVRHMQSDNYDVLILYDYSVFDCDLDVQTLLNSYSKCSLIGWSMGVWAGQKIFSKYSELLTRTVAINGTLCPINDQFGIPERVYVATMESFTEQSRLKFYKRMCREKLVFKRFLGNQPQRSVQDQLNELEVLRKTVDCSVAKDSIYRDILISKRDWVVPTANQVAFWQTSKRCTIKQIDGGHYPFDRYESWDELLHVTSLKLPLDVEQTNSRR